MRPALAPGAGAALQESEDRLLRGIAARTQMVGLFTVLLGGSALLNLPAWLLTRSRHHDASWWLPLIGVPALLAWVSLAAAGVGPQSLSNLVEPMIIAVLSVLACHAQVLVLDRWFRGSRRTSVVLMIGLTGAAVLLRLFMPMLPE